MGMEVIQDARGIVVNHIVLEVGYSVGIMVAVVAAVAVVRGLRLQSR